MITIRILSLSNKDKDWKIIEDFKSNFSKTFRFLKRFPKNFVLQVCFKDANLKELGKYGLYGTLNVWESGKETLGSLLEFVEGKEIVSRYDGGRFAMAEAGVDQKALFWLKNWARIQIDIINEIMLEC